VLVAPTVQRQDRLPTAARNVPEVLVLQRWGTRAAGASPSQRTAFATADNARVSAVSATKISASCTTRATRTALQVRSC